MSRGQGRQGRQRGHRRQGGNGRQTGQRRNLSLHLSPLPTLPISHSPTPYPQKNMQPKWLEWAQKLQAIAQTGLTFSENPYDIERFQSIQAIAAEILATHTNAELSYILDLFDRDVGYATPK